MLGSLLLQFAGGMQARSLPKKTPGGSGGRSVRADARSGAAAGGSRPGGGPAPTEDLSQGLSQLRISSSGAQQAGQGQAREPFSLHSLHLLAGKDEGRRKDKKSSDTPPRPDAGASGSSGDSERDLYEPEKVIGNGSFGVVFQAHHKQTGEIVAIKKVLQDRRFKVRSGSGFAASSVVFALKRLHALARRIESCKSCVALTTRTSCC